MGRVEVDNRGLEPPDPMLRILRALAEMAPGDELVALMDREPMLLLPELERRGYAWDLEHEPLGHYILRVRSTLVGAED